MLPERFIIPEPNSGCMIWIGQLNRDGYAVTKSKQFGTKLAHRIAFFDSGKTVPYGLVLDHLCRVRCCVNPEHLEPCTWQENIRRGKNGLPQERTHCPRGHEYTADNTRWYDNERQCRQCHRDRMVSYERRKRAEGYLRRNGRWIKDSL